MFVLLLENEQDAHPTKTVRLLKPTGGFMKTNTNPT